MAIYLDHCGTTPLARPVRDAMVAFMDSENFANPSAHHHEAGKAAWHAVEEARRLVADAINAKAGWVSFTGGASEANNIVIHGFARKHPRCRILVGATEHKSVLDPALDLRARPCCEVHVIPVDGKSGCIDLAALEGLLAANPEKLPTLVAVMWSNNEIPARNPVEAIADLCARHKAFFHCDSVQGIVREAVDVAALARAGLSSMIFAPHKIYGPKGIGVLVIPEREPMLRIDAPFQGGDQEKRLRPGTLNTLAIVGTGVAVDMHRQRRTGLVQHLRQCDEAFLGAMRSSILGFHLTVAETGSCPGIINFYIDGVDAESLVHALASEVCVNRGASCSGAGGEKARHVPTALGLPVEVAANVIRASFGFGNSLNDVIVAVEHIAAATGTGRRN